MPTRRPRWARPPAVARAAGRHIGKRPLLTHPPTQTRPRASCPRHLLPRSARGCFQGTRPLHDARPPRKSHPRSRAARPHARRPPCDRPHRRPRRAACSQKGALLPARGPSSSLARRHGGQHRPPRRGSAAHPARRAGEGNCRRGRRAQGRSQPTDRRRRPPPASRKRPRPSRRARGARQQQWLALLLPGAPLRAQ